MTILGWVTTTLFPGQLSMEIIAHNGCETLGYISVPFTPSNGFVTSSLSKTGIFNGFSANQIRDAINAGLKQ